MSKRKQRDYEVKDKMSKKSRKDLVSTSNKFYKQLATREIKYQNYVQNGFTVPQYGLSTDIAVGAVPLFGVGGSISYTSIGDNNNNRTGKKIAVNSIRCKVYLEWVPETNAVSFAVPEPVRVVLAMDKLCNGTIANSTVDTRVFQPQGLIAAQNQDTFGKYRILKDKYIHPCGQNYLGAAGAENFGGCFKMIKMNHVFKEPLIIQYNGNAANDIRQIVDNNIFMMVYTGDQNQVGITFNCFARLAFTDL